MATAFNQYLNFAQQTRINRQVRWTELEQSVKIEPPDPEAIQRLLELWMPECKCTYKVNRIHRQTQLHEGWLVIETDKECPRHKMIVQYLEKSGEYHGEISIEALAILEAKIGMGQPAEPSRLSRLDNIDE